jgi:molybdopterin/thiamine biosynthesis adenylyltransferase
MNRDRYRRHARVEGLDQAALQATRIAVIGAGAVGNEVVKNLALLGVGEIDVYDFDRVEIHNLTRSVFLRESDVGAGKAAAVAARAAEVDPNVRLRAVDGDFWRTLGLRGLAGYAAAIGCVDNFEARLRLSQLCLLAGVDLVDVGIDSRYASVATYPFSAAELPACYECHLPESAYRRVAERYSCGWLRRALHAERTVPTTAITASVAGALAVQAALRIGEDRPGGARRVLVDTRTGASTVSALARSGACAGCGEFAHRPRVVAARGDWRAAVERACAGTVGFGTGAVGFGTGAVGFAGDDPVTGVEAAALPLRLSDPLIFGYACANCGPRQEASRCVGRRADEFDDRIVRCAHCGDLSVHVDIRSEVSAAELSALLGERALPVKYLLAPAGGDVVCIDLEE